MLIHHSVGFVVLLAFTGITAVCGKAHLWIRFFRFDNPGGKGDNGHCCDGRAFICPSKCDHRFILCLDQRYGRRDTSTCPYGAKRTGEIQDQDSIVFGSRVGGVRNPMIFNFDSWPGAMRVKIGVWDEDDNNDDRVDFLMQDIDTRPARSIGSAFKQRFSVRNRVTLVMDVMVYCGSGSFGKACDVTCSPRMDSKAGYRCDPYTGRKVCLEGWTGLNCDVSVNDCVTNQCRHGATCVDGHRSHTCICAPGYTGEYCAEEIDECLSSPCQNNGVCNDEVNKFTCTCSPEWTGITCQVRDACREVTCLNGGTCFNVNGTFACECPVGFAGQVCETDIEECQSSPCRNGATCQDEIGGFRCTCSPGWEGLFCEVDVNECGSSPCSYTAVQCQDLRNDFACVCSTGYTGKRCDIDINECLKQSCQNGGTCLNLEPGFTCSCPFGFYGDTCGQDVDECEASPCAAGSTCANVPGSFRCLCAPDFSGPTCDRQIDDCVGQLCEHNGTCLDGINDFRCVCTPQYTGRKCGVYISRCLAEPCQNGAQCLDPGYDQPLQCRCTKGWTGPLCDVDENECLLEPCANEAECVNTPGSFNCTCPEGWTGLLCQEDVNECQLHLKKNQTQQSNDPVTMYTIKNPPESIAQAWCQHAGLCVNVGGGFICICQEGWQGVRCQNDVDECAKHPGPPPCQHGGKCNNTAGGYICTCPAAWNCEEDADECREYPCSDNATCINTAGSFRCVCPEGWTGNNCQEDVNECLSSSLGTATADVTPCPADDPGNCSAWVDGNPTNASPPCKNDAICQNAPGAFSCICDSGWTGATCEEDVNECVDGMGIFYSKKAGIANRNDSKNGGSEALNATESSPNAPRIPPDGTGGSPRSTLNGPVVACLQGGTCENSPGSFSCVCPPEWAGPRCEEDVNECELERTNPCHNDGQCLNTPGGFRCECSGPWEGVLCSVEKDHCQDTPCENNATCIMRSATKGGEVQCVCRRGWQGLRCLQDRDECDLDPCLNGGTCLNEIGGFRCQCPEGVVGRTCSNSSTFDEGVTLPFYLQGHYKPEEEIKMKNGVKVFLEENGGFRHDVSVMAYLKAHALAVGSTKIPVTEVYVTILVENVTLSEDDVTEVFNRVPVHDLEGYFPSPFFQRKVTEHIAVIPSLQQQSDHSPPWYTVVGGMFVVLILVLVVVVLCRKKYTFRWWPQKRSDATVIFSQNGHNHDISFDDGGMTQGQDVEYINTLPYSTTQPQHARFNNANTNGAWDSGALPWTWQQENCDDTSVLSQAEQARDGPSREPCPDPHVQDPLQGVSAEARPRPKTEVVWSCPKEIQLQENSFGTFSRVSCLAGEEEGRESDPTEAGESEDKEESRCFVNAIYMTIPVNTERGAGSGNYSGACTGDSIDQQVYSFPPDPNRGALPPPPASRGGALPSSEVNISD